MATHKNPSTKPIQPTPEPEQGNPKNESGMDRRLEEPTKKGRHLIPAEGPAEPSRVRVQPVLQPSPLSSSLSVPMAELQLANSDDELSHIKMQRMLLIGIVMLMAAVGAYVAWNIEDMHKAKKERLQQNLEEAISHFPKDPAEYNNRQTFWYS